MEKRIIRMPEVESTVGLSAATIYRKIKVGEFPAQIKLGKHASGWLLSDISAWVSGEWPRRDARARTTPLAEVLDSVLESEMLRTEEVAAITGHKSSIDQAKWLTGHRWRFLSNSEGRVIVGRMYARLMLCGIDPATWP